jgi:hypothetical protein
MNLSVGLGVNLNVYKLSTSGKVTAFHSLLFIFRLHCEWVGKIILAPFCVTVHNKWENTVSIQHYDAPFYPYTVTN